MCRLRNGGCRFNCGGMPWLGIEPLLNIDSRDLDSSVRCCGRPCDGTPRKGFIGGGPSGADPANSKKKIVCFSQKIAAAFAGYSIYLN